jgi:Ulp1 family protease
MRTEVRRSEQGRLSVVSRHESSQRKREQSVVIFTHKTHSSKLKAHTLKAHQLTNSQLTDSQLTNSKTHQLKAHNLKNSPTNSSQSHHLTIPNAD